MIAIPIVMLLAAATASQISRRMSRLQGQVDRIAEGDFQQLALSERDDEIRALGQAVNRMAEMLARYEDDIRHTERMRTLAQASKVPAAGRVASFLAALSRMGASEGRDPAIITDEFSSGAVADHLNMSVDALANALRDLEARGIVTPVGDGLRIADLEALEHFADAA